MNKYTEAIQRDDVVILCDGIPMGVGEILAALNAAPPPADAALADDALCESIIEASDMRWNGDVYVGDGADLMNLVRAALRARAVPEADVRDSLISGCAKPCWCDKCHAAMLAAKEKGQ